MVLVRTGMLAQKFTGGIEMATRRKSLKLYDHERSVLVRLYLERRIPIAQYESRPEDRQLLADEWQEITGRTDLAGELVRYMKNQRKNSKWVTFEGDHEIAPPVLKLTPEETEILVNIYYQNVTVQSSGSDTLAHDDLLAASIAREFSDAVGRVVPAHHLIAKLTALRKRGLLPKVEDLPKEEHGDEDHGFHDIDEAINM